MNKKQKEMIRYLTEQNKAVTSLEISNALDISTRSVKNYVQEINHFYGKNIISSSRAGYILNNKSGSNLIISIDDEDIPQTMEERAFYIVKELILNHSSHLELFDLCDVLCISYSTIKSVISKMNKTFSSYHVSFVCENDCVYIKGSEYNKRKLISYIINEESKNSYLNMNLLRSNFKDLDIKCLQEVISRIFKKHNYYLNDFAATNLLLHMLIIIDREINGNPLDSSHSHIDDIKSIPEYTFLIDLKEEIEKSFKIQLNDYEIFEIYMLFKANANFSLNNDDEELKKIVGDEIILLVEKYVKAINNFYMIDLSGSSFTAPFSIHLKNLIFRAKSGRFTSNPMAETIKNNNPIVFDIAIYIALDLMNIYNIEINEDETAFLAMHIGAEVERQNINKNKIPAILICPNYHEMATTLFNKIMLNFGSQINIIDTYADELEFKQKYSKQKVSIIFTTVPITFSIQNASIIKISPINITAQVKTIQDAILREREHYKDHKLKLNFHNFFEEDLFVSNANLKTKQQVITYLCDTLIAKNYVEQDFEKQIYQRENAATTAFGNVAIPHSVQMNAVKTCISVVISKKGIQWDSNTVHIVLLLAINKADKRTFRYLYESLISLFGEDGIIQEVRNCTKFEEFEKLIYSKIQTREE